MNVFKSSSNNKEVVVLKNVDMIRKSHFFNVRSDSDQVFPQIVVCAWGKETTLTYGAGEEYTRDQEFDALTKALGEYHG